MAIFLHDKIPQLEYVFCDTHEELPETYDYLDRLEAFLGRKITRLNPERGFEHWLRVYNGVLPPACCTCLPVRQGQVAAGTLVHP